MNYKMMCRFLALICLAETVFFLPALGISIYDGSRGAILGFAISATVSLALYIVFKLIARRTRGVLYAKEGFVCVASSWILMSAIGALPFVISGEIPNYVDALFETVSGFTTTGSSIFTDVEVLPRGLIYWRSFTHWVGGLGILVFLLMMVPGGKNEGFTMHLFRAESPGPEVGKLVPKMRQTATVLYMTYIVLTVLNFTFLILGDMNTFEALCTAFGTAGTGGFGIKNDSMASYSPYIQNVTTVFLILFGVNFSCYYLLILRQFKSVFCDEELRLYLGIVTAAIAMIAINVFATGFYGTFGESLRHAAFQVASIISTAGFSTTDFDLWPMFSKSILAILMITGACAGSTCGGMKCARVLLLFKNLRRNIHNLLHPQQVQVVRVNGRAVDEKVIANTNGYLAAYVIILFVSFVAISLFDNNSIGTNFSAVLTCFNNVGPGFEAVGPMANFAHLSIPSKLILTFDMLAGRLEIFPLLLLFSGSVWKKA
ncbi:MAG: TrkH family potassium uptake protein [Clostridia bacterium]|nr:TrkH family potassium uptake protein [Clostridia bacterium]